jgi:hypothetical protein
MGDVGNAPASGLTVGTTTITGGTDKRLLFKLAWNMGLKAMLSVEKHKRRLKKGEVFNRSLLKKGLEDIQKLYGDEGYIYTSVGPVLDPDDANKVINLTMQVDERVKNLSQVSVGDTVSVAYYESWALSLDGSGDASSASVGRTTTGAGMPAVYAARRTNVRATVTAIDAGKPSVTFRGPEGRVQEVSVAQDPRVLARLKVGESYDVTYTEHLAMIVEKTAKR